MHINQLALAKSSIKRKTHIICLRTCHTADFGQVWPEKDTHDRPSDKVVTQRTMAKCGKNNDAPCWRTLSHCGLWPNVARNVPLIGEFCHAADFDQMWPKMCPLLEDFVTQLTLTKCGLKCAPHWRTLSNCRLWPNMAQNVPLIGGLCQAVDFDQMWLRMCPLLEDFVTQRASAKCGPKCAPHWRTLSHSGLQPNVAQNVPLIGGLCHTAVDFDQMWPKMCPSLEDFVTQNFDQMWPKNVPLIGGLYQAADFNQMWPKMWPSSEDFVTQRTLTKCGPNMCPLTDDFV